MNKALLFINGEIPKSIPDFNFPYSIISCTDGAYTQYVYKYPIKINYISGDMDSISLPHIPQDIPFIITPDQNKTDFHKALEILINKGIREVDIWGASGKESDHFIGNLSTALFFKNQIKITFHDDYSIFFFTDKKTKLRGVKNKIISLIPFFETRGITTTGLQYPLNNEVLSFATRIGTRNRAFLDEISVSYSQGELLIYIGK